MYLFADHGSLHAGWGWGWNFFGVVWGLPLAEIIFKAVTHGRNNHWISTAVYVAMGWLVVIFPDFVGRNDMAPQFVSVSPNGNWDRDSHLSFDIKHRNDHAGIHQVQRSSDCLVLKEIFHDLVPDLIAFVVQMKAVFFEEIGHRLAIITQHRGSRIEVHKERIFFGEILNREIGLFHLRPLLPA